MKASLLDLLDMEPLARISRNRSRRREFQSSPGFIHKIQIFMGGKYRVPSYFFGKRGIAFLFCGLIQHINCVILQYLIDAHAHVVDIRYCESKLFVYT